jgi:hypothetical protein
LPRPYYGHTDMFNSEECCLSVGAVRLQARFRILWEQHVYWTRMVIVGIVFDTPDLEATTDRLLRNVPDFARIFRRFYGTEVADEFGRLLKDHLVIAADFVKAAKAGDKDAAEDLEKRWYKNGDQIAHFLSCINPYWSYQHLRAMWFEHLKLTKEEAVTELGEEYAKSIETFDKVEKEAIMMADVFANGVICQFNL